MSGKYCAGWQSTTPINPNFKCKCGSNDVEYRDWQSNCGGFEDTHYRCKTCGHSWWVESADA